MKKKVLGAILVLTMALCCAFGLAACREKNDPPKAEWTVESVYAHAQSLGYAGTLEEFLAQIQGADGVGIQTVSIDQYGNLIVTLSNGQSVNCGKVTGADGADGVGVKSATIDERGHLIVTLTNDQTIDCGKVTGAPGQNGQDGQDGQDGADGVGVKFVSIDERGHLIVTLTNNETIDCGNVREETVEQEEHPYLVISHGSVVGVTAAGRQQTSLTVPDTFGGEAITHIAPYALADLRKLKTLVIADGITDIGKYALSGCWALESLTVPFVGANIDQVGPTQLSYLFGDLSANDIIIPPTLSNVAVTQATSIGEKAFEACDSLTSITLSERVTSIGDYAFQDCPIVNATIPTTAISAIPKNDLEKVVFNGGSTLDNALSNCKTLKSITIASTITNIESYAFSSCSHLTEVHITDLAAWCNISFGGSSSNPLSNGAALYLNGQVITELTIPSSLSQIKDCAFYGCTSISSVTIPNSVTTIGSGAFWNCSALTAVAIEEGVTDLGVSAFANCSTLTSITIPNSVTTIGSDAFENCDALTAITIPDSVTTIGNYAFSDCRALTIYCETPRIPGGWNSSWYGSCPVVWNCQYTDVATDSNIYVVVDSVRYALGWDTATVAEQPINIAGAITIAANIMYKGQSYPVTTIKDRAFSECNALISVSIGDNITTIGQYAFDDCTALKSVVIGNGTMTIEQYAFNNCDNLETVVMGRSVSTIEQYAFYSSNKITTVYYCGTRAEWNDISIGSYGNSYLTSATRYYYSAEQPVDEGNYWHYDVDGKTPVIWSKESV